VVGVRGTLLSDRPCLFPADGMFVHEEAHQFWNGECGMGVIHLEERAFWDSVEICFFFDKVMLVDNGKDTTIGTPYIPKAAVQATITKIGRLPKVDVVKYKQKSRYFKRNGHKQPMFQVKIDAVK
jgi:ribosomal protein L21